MASQHSSADHLLRQTYRDFINGCHILHYHHVLDAYGHLSVRDPTNPTQFLMSRYIAPATISSPSDLILYNVSDAQPVDPTTAAPGYSERYIHSEILKRYPDVHAVVHSHSEAVVPYTISGVPMRACFHMAGFLGSEGAPVWDIRKCYDEDSGAQGQEKGKRDMLVRNERLGAALAERFDGEGSKAEGREPRHAVVLMRGHGFTVHGPSIMDVVLRAVYTQQNAGIQSTALVTRAAYLGKGWQEEGEGLYFLDEAEVEGATDMTRRSVMRPWGLWVREVEANGLYVNMA